jgi:hypothetical protein
MTTAIRPAERKDIPALAKFLARVYKFAPSDHHADPQFLEWKYLRPGHDRARSRSYLLEKEGGIVAHCGICPVTFHLPGGTTVNSATMMDWAADPSSPGVGIRLFRNLMEMTATSFVIGGAPATRLIVPRIGFRPAGEASIYAAWLRPWREFRTRPFSGRSALRLLHGFSHPLRNRHRADTGWELTAISLFDESILPLLSTTKRNWTFCQRTLADLNHLLQCPHLKMQGFLLKRQGQLVGSFVIGKAGWEARLLDLVLDSDRIEDWSLACAAVTEAARLDPQICRIRIQATFPVLRDALGQNGYWLQYNEPIMIHDPTKVLDRAFPVSFQLFDGDSGY